MSSTSSIDRRAEYYAKVAEHIANDPLDFYVRAERGRRWLYDRFKIVAAAPPPAKEIQRAKLTLAWKRAG
jgi:hypothetical protein